MLLPPFFLKLHSALALIFRVELVLLQTTGQISLMIWAKKVRMFGMSHNPASPCLLFALLFELFVLSRKIACANPDLGENGSKKNTKCSTRPLVVCDHAEGRGPGEEGCVCGEKGKHVKGGDAPGDGGR